MRELMTVQVGGRYIVVPRFIGATLVIIAVIMIVVATADVVLTWDRIKSVEKCVYSARAAGNGDELAALTQLQTCAILGQQAGVEIRLDRNEKAVPDEEKWNAMLPKVAAWLGWILLLVIAILIYQTGRLVFPIREERYAEILEPEAKAVATEKKTKRRTRKTRSRKKR